jgi:hypothetical protein
MPILIILFSSAFLQWFGPWWLIALPCIGVGFFHNLRGRRAFFTGFIAIATLWLGYAEYLNARNHQLLAGKMAELFHLPSVTLMLLVTAVLGGLAGGLATLSGFELSRLWKKIILFFQVDTPVPEEVTPPFEASN